MWSISENKTWAYLIQRFEWVLAMEQVPQDTIHHAEGNVAIHTQMVLEALALETAFHRLNAQEQEILWAAALLHDVEKYSTTVIESDGRITAHGHARKGALRARNILYRDVPAPFVIREQIAALVRYHGLPLWILEKRDPLRELIKASLEVNTQWLFLLARADVLGRICTDQADLLYRLDCFEEFCRENGCWGTSRPFASSYARMHYMQKEGAHPDYVPFEAPETEVVLISGLPGAGKDTYIKKYFPDMPLISLDNIRNEWSIAPTDKTGNGQVIQAAREQARSYLRRHTGFVWNATNTTRQMRSQLIALFHAYNAKVKLVYIEAAYQQLQRQNRNREAIVPVGVQEKLINKLEVPVLWEADEVCYHIW
jgi:putative nucleotidyltransferase with HDIG domain